MPDDAELLSIAVAAAGAAAPLLLERFGARQRELATKSSPDDLVGEADLAAERAIREAILARRPDDGVLGEEGGDAAGSSGLQWVVDPLDGTLNYLFGVPLWAVSVAVREGGRTHAGIVLDPVRGDAWTATWGGPAACNGEPLAGSRAQQLERALVATGFGYDPGVRAAQARTVARLLPRVRDIRRGGSAALDLAWAAAGRYDAYYERGVAPWDVAAGALLCERAGLAVEPLAPDPPAAAGLLVAAPALCAPLRALL